MDETCPAATIQLSRDELLLTLHLLGVNTIPGLDPDPEGPINTKEEVLALRVAGRSLQAREVARIDKAGELLLHEMLLTAVGTCAFAQNSLFIYHWPVVNKEPHRYFIHKQGDNIVVHSRPSPIIHGFTLIPDAPKLVDQIFTLCHYNEVPLVHHYEFTIPSEIFIQVRHMAQNDQLPSAQDLLMANGQSKDVAAAFTSTLGDQQVRIAVFQSLKSFAEMEHKEDFTLLQVEQYSWLLTPINEDAKQTSLLIETTTTEYLEAIFLKSFV